MTGIPRVSVVITAYNRARYVAQAIESVIAQTLPDFELVIVDDASTDDTVEIARAYSKRDPRIRLHVNDVNKGQFPNRNFAASLAVAPLFKFHDSDDVMYAHCLEVMVSAMEAEPRADFALTSHRTWPGGPCPILLTPQLAFEREFFGTGIFQLGPSCGLFRRDFFQSVGGFDDHGITSDYLFWFKACAKGRALLVASDLFFYRVHPDQALQSAQTVADHARARGLAWRFLNGARSPLEGAPLELAKRNFVFTVARDAYYQIRDGNFRGGLTLVRALPTSVWLQYLRPPQRSNDGGTRAASSEESPLPQP